MDGGGMGMFDADMLVGMTRPFAFLNTIISSL